MAKNIKLQSTAQKSLFPVLFSSANELFSVESETHKYTLQKSAIERVLSSVEAKNKNLKIATVGIVGSNNNDRHKVYTDMLIQYLENRLRTNEKIVEKFLKGFDEQCPRLTSSSSGVYFWPKIYTITSRKKERCRLLILFFDGISNRTLEILASAICSQMYVFREAGKNILATELHNLRDNFTKTLNVTLRNPCTTVIKSENDPPRSFRMFLKDWVDFRLDFFKHKDTMFNDWEQLMCYLVKTEGAINAYISRTELRLISNVLVTNHDQKRQRPEKVNTGPNIEAAGPSGSYKHIPKGQPLPSPIPDRLPKPDSVPKQLICVQLGPTVNLDYKIPKPVRQAPAPNLVKPKEDPKHTDRHQPSTTQDLIGTIKILLYTWIVKKLNMGNIDLMLDCCTYLLPFHTNRIFGELAHLKFAIHSYNSELGNMFDHQVSFQGNENESPLLQKCKDVQQNLYQSLQEKCPKNIDLILYLLKHACLELKHQYSKDNELISLHETNNTNRVSDKIYDMYREKLGQNVQRYQVYEQAAKHHETLKTYCTRVLARCLDYDSRHSPVLLNESILLTKKIDNYFQLVCEGKPWTQKKTHLASNVNTAVVPTIRQNKIFEDVKNESGIGLDNNKTLLIRQCASIINQLNKREVILRPLTRKVIEESIKRAQDMANDKLTTKDTLVTEAKDLDDLVLEYGFKKC